MGACWWRTGDGAPFASQWTLPMTIVRETEAAEDALRRHTVEQFGVGLGGETFVETVYLVDPDDQHQYVANIFRIRATGPLRFDAEGDYDDARWLTPADIEQLWMPPDLRVPLLKILTEPEALRETDWSRAGEGLPLAERAGRALPLHGGGSARTGGSADRTTGRGGMRFPTRISASSTASDSASGSCGRGRFRRTTCICWTTCGASARDRAWLRGGQDVVALDRMGAIAVGIDQSREQIEYAKAYALRHGALNASFVEGDCRGPLALR